MAGLGPRVISWCKPLASPIWKHHQLPTTTAVKVHGAQVVEAVGPRGRIRRGMGFRVEHEKRQMLRVLMFQEIQNKDLMYLHYFWKETILQTLFWFLTSTFFFVTANVLIPWCFFYKEHRAWGPSKVFVITVAASGCGCVFFPKRGMIFQVRTVNFLITVKKQKIDIYIESIAAEKSTNMRSFLDNLFDLFQALWP